MDNMGFPKKSLEKCRLRGHFAVRLRQQARRLKELIEQMSDRPGLGSEDYALYETVMGEVERDLRDLKRVLRRHAGQISKQSSGTTKHNQLKEENLQ